MSIGTLGRAGILALGAILCALVCGFAALWVQQATLPPTDLAYGLSVVHVLGDPFVRLVWIPVTLGAGLSGFFVSLWALWRVQLAKAGPLTFAVTAVASAVAAYRSVLLSLPVAFLSGAIVMIWCRHHTTWALPEHASQ